MLLAVPAIGSGSTWVTLTVAGLAMGFIVFVIASGLTLVFGLMDVLNFGHGVFIALGAFMATSVMGGLAGFSAQGGWQSLVVVFAAMLVAMAVAGALGWAFERVIVRPVYGLHLKQILITMGGMIVGEEIIKVIWGPLQIASYLLTTVNGTTPDAATLNAAVTALDGETGAAQGTFLWHLAESAQNQLQVNLVGLAQTGLEFV